MSATDLATERYLEDAAFLEYLRYLRYWQRPEYVQFIAYVATVCCWRLCAHREALALTAIGRQLPALPADAGAAAAQGLPRAAELAGGHRLHPHAAVLPLAVLSQCAYAARRSNGGADGEDRHVRPRECPSTAVYIADVGHQMAALVEYILTIHPSILIDTSIYISKYLPIAPSRVSGVLLASGSLLDSGGDRTAAPSERRSVSVSSPRAAATSRARYHDLLLLRVPHLDAAPRPTSTRCQGQYARSWRS